MEEWVVGVTVLLAKNNCALNNAASPRSSSSSNTTTAEELMYVGVSVPHSMGGSFDAVQDRLCKVVSRKLALSKTVHLPVNFGESAKQEFWDAALRHPSSQWQVRASGSQLFSSPSEIGPWSEKRQFEVRVVVDAMHGRGFSFRMWHSSPETTAFALYPDASSAPETHFAPAIRLGFEGVEVLGRVVRAQQVKKSGSERGSLLLKGGEKKVAYQFHLELEHAVQCREGTVATCALTLSQKTILGNDHRSVGMHSKFEKFCAGLEKLSPLVVGLVLQDKGELVLTASSMGRIRERLLEDRVVEGVVWPPVGRRASIPPLFSAADDKSIDAVQMKMLLSPRGGSALVKELTREDVDAQQMRNNHGHDKWRKMLISRWGGQCMASGSTVAVEAVRVAAWGEDDGADALFCNGILLSASYRAAYEAKQFRLVGKMDCFQIEVHQDMLADPLLALIHGKTFGGAQGAEVFRSIVDCVTKKYKTEFM